MDFASNWCAVASLVLAVGCGGGGLAAKGDAMGGTQSASGGSDAGGTAGTLEAPPSPPTAGVPQPMGSVTSPNLRILPWAGFSSAISFTFDDSQPSQLEHWPELSATGVPLTFFVNPSGQAQAGYDATWTAAAAAGNEIGNHTWTHCHVDFSGCTPVGTAEQEIDQTNDYITSHFGVTAVYSFAAPFGEAGWNTYASPRFLVGRGVQNGTVPASGTTDWYNLPAFTVAAGQTATNFNAFIDSAKTQGRWGIFLFHSLLPTANNWYAGVEIADVTASIAYPASLGDVWVGTMTQVGAYARAQQMFEGLTPTDNTWTWTLPEHFPPHKVLRVTVDGGTLEQGGTALGWDAHGYYEVALDAGTLTWAP